MLGSLKSKDCLGLREEVEEEEEIEEETIEGEEEEEEEVITSSIDLFLWKKLYNTLLFMTI